MNCKQKKYYAVYEKTGARLPLFVGSLKEVSAYTGVSEVGIMSAISKAKSRGTNCRYACFDLEEDDE